MLPPPACCSGCDARKGPARLGFLCRAAGVPSRLHLYPCFGAPAPGWPILAPMSKTTVPDEVRRFILTSIPSVPYLEALLLLRAESLQPWDSYRLAGRLYIGEGQAFELLQAMQQGGVVTRREDGSFVYSPADRALVQLIDALANTYSQDLVGVTDLIHARRDKRAQQFANAFRWKKEGN